MKTMTKSTNDEVEVSPATNHTNTRKDSTALLRKSQITPRPLSPIRDIPVYPPWRVQSVVKKCNEILTSEPIRDIRVIRS